MLLFCFKIKLSLLLEYPKYIKNSFIKTFNISINKLNYLSATLFEIKFCKLKMPLTLDPASGIKISILFNLIF